MCKFIYTVTVVIHKVLYLIFMILYTKGTLTFTNQYLISVQWIHVKGDVTLTWWYFIVICIVRHGIRTLYKLRIQFNTETVHKSEINLW